MLVYLRDGPTQIVGAATLREKLQIELYLAQTQYTDTGPSPSVAPVTRGIRQGLFVGWLVA